VLLVAFGAPKQDLWIARYQESLGVSLAIGVGGLFDFYSGRIKRAPLWVRELSLEWLYRLLQEPGRMWRRYFMGIPIFLFRVLRGRLLTEAGHINPDTPYANHSAIPKSR
jgi:N-acetylglucosaminyldiphosphoundecaprenol N-acetyl-beta-D-mannosaminyltransferase